MFWVYPAEDVRNIYVLSAFFSAFLSLFVIITYLFFARLRNKLFMKLIVYVSFCDFIGNCTIFSGTPSADGALCFWQGLLQQFFYPASWLWTLVLVYSLYSLIIDGKLSLKMRHMHLACWGVPLLLTLLPFATDVTYSRSENDDDWCWLHSSTSSSFSSRTARHVWEYISLDGLVLGCVAVMLYWGAIIYRALKTQKIKTTSSTTSALRALLHYPIILFVTWIPNAVVMAGGWDTSMDSPRMLVVNSLSIWQGGLTAIVFFVHSNESRKHWVDLIASILPVSLQWLAPARLSNSMSELRYADSTSGMTNSEGSSVSRSINIEDLEDVTESPSASYFGTMSFFLRDSTLFGARQQQQQQQQQCERDSTIAMSEIKNPIVFSA